jgi:hypothetical protein
MTHPHSPRVANPARSLRALAVPAIALAAAATALAGGCAGPSPSASGKPAPSDAAPVRGDAGGGLAGPAVAASDGRLAVVNDRCPVMQQRSLPGMRVRGDKVRQFEGKAVGFCCGECLEAWTTMSQNERRDALRAVTPAMDR